MDGVKRQASTVKRVPAKGFIIGRAKLKYRAKRKMYDNYFDTVPRIL